MTPCRAPSPGMTLQQDCFWHQPRTRPGLCRSRGSPAPSGTTLHPAKTLWGHSAALPSPRSSSEQLRGCAEEFPCLGKDGLPPPTWGLTGHCGATPSPKGHRDPGQPPPGTGWGPGRQPSPRCSLRDGLTNFLSSIASCPFRLGGQLRKQSERGNRRRPRGSVPPGSAALPGGTGVPAAPRPQPRNLAAAPHPAARG